MSVERIYTVSRVKGGKSSNKVLPALLFIGVLIAVALGVWYIKGKKQPENLTNNNAQIPPAAKDTSVAPPVTTRITKPIQDIGTNKKSAIPQGAKVVEMDKSAAGNKPISTNTIVGRVLYQQPNQLDTGEPGVSVYYFYNNIKKEVITDSEGNYQIAVPVDKEDAIDCKIILYYKKGNELNTQQTISCNQKNISDIKFTSL